MLFLTVKSSYTVFIIVVTDLAFATNSLDLPATFMNKLGEKIDVKFFGEVGPSLSERFIKF